MDISIVQLKFDIHTWIYPWIYPWISISTATLVITYINKCLIYFKKIVIPDFIIIFNIRTAQ